MSYRRCPKCRSKGYTVGVTDKWGPDPHCIFCGYRPTLTPQEFGKLTQQKTIKREPQLPVGKEK